MTERITIVCDYCALTQFLHHDELCARCHKMLYCSAKPEPEIKPVMEWPESHWAIARWLSPRLTQFRKRLHMPQAELARRMDVKRTYISKAERGWVVPGLVNLARFAQAFGVATVELLDIEVDPDPQMREIGALACKLSRKQRAEVL